MTKKLTRDDLIEAANSVRKARIELVKAAMLIQMEKSHWGNVAELKRSVISTNKVLADLSNEILEQELSNNNKK